MRSSKSCSRRFSFAWSQCRSGFIGKDFRVTRDRGKLIPSGLAPHVMATTHPSSILRAPDSQERERQRRRVAVRDLKKVADLLRNKNTYRAA